MLNYFNKFITFSAFSYYFKIIKIKITIVFKFYFSRIIFYPLLIEQFISLPTMFILQTFCF